MPVIRCPACKQRYEVKAAAGGRRARCRSCGQVFRIPPLDSPAGSAEEELRLSDLDRLATGQAVEDPGATKPAAAIPVSDTVSYAPNQEAAGAATAGGAYRAYLRSLARSLALSLSTSNLITFLVAWVILSAALVANLGLGMFCPCVAPILALFAYSWYLSFQLNVVLEAAAGEDELPALTFTGDWLEEIILPFIKMAAATGLARVPATIFLMLSLAQQGAGGLNVLILALSFLLGGNYGLLLEQASFRAQLVGGLLLVGGFLLWPMFVLVVAVGGLPGLLRLDLMILTIFKSLPAYLLTAAAVYASEAVVLGTGLLLGAIGLGVIIKGADVSWLLLLPLLLILVQLYTRIIAMRAIGYYYFHFKHRFAWSWG